MWEYFIMLLLIYNMVVIFNNWGKQGWEFVQVVQGLEGGFVVYLKCLVSMDVLVNVGFVVVEQVVCQFEGGQV